MIKTSTEVVMRIAPACDARRSINGIVNGELLYPAAIYRHERTRLRPISLALNSAFSPPPLAEARFALARTLQKWRSCPRSCRNAKNVG